MNNKSLYFNLMIVILEIIGIILGLTINHTIGIEYYTTDSNLLALISSLLFVIFIISKNKIPRWLQLFKYITTICLTVTFLVVVFILGPMLDFDYEFLLFNNNLLLQHLLCPLFSIIVFLFFDDISILKIKDTFIGISLTIVYAIILIILNYTKLVTGPYPFLKVYEQSLFMSIFWLITILGLSYLIALLLRKIYIKIHKISD